MSKIEKNVEELINPIVTNLGYKLYDVIYEKEAKDYYLRIFIGQEVEVKLFKPFNGEKLITGILNGFDEETINIDEQEIPRKDISLIKIKYNW